jgi:hypothetical protein
LLVCEEREASMAKKSTPAMPRAGPAAFLMRRWRAQVISSIVVSVGVSRFERALIAGHCGAWRRSGP